MKEAQMLLDVNAAAGELRQIFTVDVTTALSQCSWCGTMAPFAESRVYATEPGLILRCNNCDSILVRVVMGPGRAWLDLRGLKVLQLMMPP
jgi:hypothetical protein